MIKAIKSIFTCFTLLIVLAGCKTKDTEPTPDKGEVAFEVSEAEYTRLISARLNAPRRFEIKDVKRENDILKIWVTGGCDKSRYRVVWDGIMRKSYPLTVFLVVSLEKATGNECDAVREYILEIDLREKFGEIYDTHALHILLSNGSEIDDKIIAPDGSISNK
jgi:hypothetical protein